MKKALFILAIFSLTVVISCKNKSTEDDTKAIEQAQEKAADSSLSKGLDQLNKELSDSVAKDTSAKRV